MSDKWADLAEKLDQELRRGLSGSTSARRAVLHVRGAAGAGPAGGPAYQVVIASFAHGVERPTPERIHRDLGLPATTIIDLYFVTSKPWYQLEIRELNPEDPVAGEQHKRLLEQLGAVRWPASQRPRPCWP